MRQWWRIEHGREIGFVDLGDAASVKPGDIVVASELRRLPRDRYGVGMASTDDPDLAVQQPWPRLRKALKS